jgi:hypothetical protein
MYIMMLLELSNRKNKNKLFQFWRNLVSQSFYCSFLLDMSKSEKKKNTPVNIDGKTFQFEEIKLEDLKNLKEMDEPNEKIFKEEKKEIQEKISKIQEKIVILFVF